MKEIKDFIEMMGKNQSELEEQFDPRQGGSANRAIEAIITVRSVIKLSPEYQAFLALVDKEETPEPQTLIEYFKATGREPMSKRDMIVLSEYLNESYLDKEVIRYMNK